MRCGAATVETGGPAAARSNSAFFAAGTRNAFTTPPDWHGHGVRRARVKGSSARMPSSVAN